MAVITDVGDPIDIHPKRKEPVGARLALAALALAYNKPIAYSGPIYESMKVEGNKAILSFKHIGGGLVAKDGPLTGFTIAGEDHKFVNAQAEIQDDKVIVSMPRWPNRSRSATAGPIARSSICGTRTACPPRRSAPIDFPILTGPKSSKKGSLNPELRTTDYTNNTDRKCKKGRGDPNTYLSVLSVESVVHLVRHPS